MFAASSFRINTPVVANEILDGEAVLIHFESGCSSSTDKLGAASPVVDNLFSLAGGTAGPGASPGGPYQYYAGAKLVACLASHGELLAYLEREVRWTVAARAPRRLFVHAGVVGWRGRAVVIPGASYGG